MSRGSTKLLLAVVALIAAACTCWYLQSFEAQTVIVGGLLAAALLFGPLLAVRHGPPWQIPAIWLIGGLVGAYGFGIYVVAAGLLGLPLALLRRSSPED